MAMLSCVMRKRQLCDLPVSSSKGTPAQRQVACGTADIFQIVGLPPITGRVAEHASEGTGVVEPEIHSALRCLLSMHGDIG